MNLKKCLIAATLATSAIATPALADLRVNVGIGVPVAPPMALYEPVPPPPAYGYVWAPGYWAWHGDRYIWIRGRYVFGQPGYVWRPERWENRGDRYHFISGDWERDRHWRGERGEEREHRGRGHDR